MLTESISAGIQNLDRFFHKVKWPQNGIKNFECSQKVTQSTYEKAKPIFGKPKPSFINCQEIQVSHQLQAINLQG